jgi:uncharacterized SAM-binding protein YcdF (DUF218 family)
MKPSRRRRRIALVVLALPVIYLAITFAQVWRAAHHDGARRAQAIVVLGAAQYDGVPSPTLRVRLDHVIELWNRHLADTVVVTGGKQPGDRFTEATASATYLVAHGIPDDKILRETNGRSTYQSLADASGLLKERGITKVVLVSDPYHAARIEGIAGELGLDATVSPTATGRAIGPSLAVRYAEETAVVAAARVVGFRRMVGVSSRVREEAPVR